MDVESFLNGARAALGLDENDLSLGQMMLRAAVVYPIAVAMVRFGDKRFIGKFSAFDVILGIMIGSILSRAITGNSPFLPTLGAGVVLVLLHALFSLISFHCDLFGVMVKGRGRTLVQDGQILWDAMLRSRITERDLMSSLRQSGCSEDVSRVRLARLERNGNISVIMKDD